MSPEPSAKIQSGYSTVTNPRKVRSQQYQHSDNNALPAPTVKRPTVSAYLPVTNIHPKRLLNRPKKPHPNPQPQLVGSMRLLQVVRPHVLHSFHFVFIILPPAKIVKTLLHLLQPDLTRRSNQNILCENNQPLLPIYIFHIVYPFETPSFTAQVAASLLSNSVSIVTGRHVHFPFTFSLQYSFAMYTRCIHNYIKGSG
jgi:hypothetical protein